MGRQAGRSGSGRRPAPPCAKHPERLAVHRRRLAALLPSKKSTVMRRSRSGQTRGVDGGVRRLGREVGVLVDAEGACPAPDCSQGGVPTRSEFDGRRGNGRAGRPSGSPRTSSTSKTGNPGSPTYPLCRTDTVFHYQGPLRGCHRQQPRCRDRRRPAFAGCSLSSAQQIRSTLIPQHPNIVTLARPDDREKTAPMTEKRAIVERDRKDTPSSSTIGRPNLGDRSRSRARSRRQEERRPDPSSDKYFSGPGASAGPTVVKGDRSE